MTINRQLNSGPARPTSRSGGQAMIATVFLSVIISSVFVLGLGGPVYRSVKSARQSFDSKQSWFAAESGVEDVVYRLRNGVEGGSQEELSVAGSQASVVITDVPVGKEIESVGELDSLIRKTTAAVKVGQGAAFHYGVQAGAGGFTLNNNAGVNGSVYANGVIEGENGAFVTGSAISASAAALTADQANNQPASPDQEIIFRDTAGTQDIAQSFKLAGTEPLNKAKFYLKKTGNPGSATVKIVSNVNGEPGTNTLTSGTLSSSQVTNVYNWVEVVFESAPALEANTTYWLVIDSGSNSANHYYQIGSGNAYSQGQTKIGSLGGSWGNTSPPGLDLYFEIYLGGQTGLIDNIDVGTAGEGDAWAYEVNNSTVAGGLYCQIGSSNNQACDTSRVDPSPVPFPISDGNIAVWKEQAEAGGVTNSDYILNESAGSLGPQKIDGHLTVENNSVLTITGTVWVTGNFTISNNAQVKLDPGFGANSAVIVVDGVVNISNNGVFSGSGEVGSYIMVLTTSDCPASSSCNGADAIHVSNNAGTVILNAQKGTISFADNSGTKSVTAYKIQMWNNAVVNYDIGLINQNFTNGPSGGFEISSWSETE